MSPESAPAESVLAADTRPRRLARPFRSLRFDLGILAGGFLPGALVGVHLAGLIFFLNPGLPFTPGPVLRGILLYGGLLGLASLVLHLPFTWRKPRRARRFLPWGLTVALVAAAVLDGAHASHFAYFLPPGINDRLIRTAVWLALAALISFYTALLHTLQRRRYGVRSRAAYVTLAVLSVYAMIERRETFRPRPVPAPRPAAAEAGERPRLWVIGLDTATLDAILPLADRGRLPFLAQALERGAYGRLESIEPPRREPLWTTLATGKYPYRHGVAGAHSYPSRWIAPGAELQLLPQQIGFRRWGMAGLEERRLSAYRRQALVLWEILPRLGIPTGVVSWPAATPVAHETLFALSEGSFFGEDPQGTWPREIAERAKLFRVRPEEIDRAERDRFKEGPPPVLAALAGDLWRQTLTSALRSQHPETGAIFLTLPGLRQVSVRFFGGYDAVQFDGSQGAAQRRASDLVAAYYEQLDRFLARTWEAEEGPRILAVVSPYGVEPRGMGWWRRATGRSTLAGSSAGAPDGALLLYGEGIRPGQLLTGARLADVAPTLLYALGLPVAQDLDGQVLTAAFDQSFLAEHPLTFLPSYEGLAER